MKSTADVVIVGGGVIGTSLLFNLGRLGVTDTLLLEKDVLGSESTGQGPIHSIDDSRDWQYYHSNDETRLRTINDVGNSKESQECACEGSYICIGKEGQGSEKFLEGQFNLLRQ